MDLLMPVPTSEAGIWQLRRVGPPSTVQNSASLIRLLEDGEVTIGRGPAADYFLDSAVTLRLISRIHASIRGERVPGGHPKFTLINSGLNGTYINDLKMKYYPDNQQVLLEGDRITFGHPGCASIQPGAYAPQLDSEFQFIFECVPASRVGSVDQYCTHSRTGALNGNPRHNHQQKQAIAGNAGPQITDSPQSNASTSEKENEIANSMFRNVKNVSSSNGVNVRPSSKHNLGDHESLQSDSMQSRLAKCVQKKPQVLCNEKKFDEIDGVALNPPYAQHGHSNGKLSVSVASANVKGLNSSVNWSFSNGNLGCSNSDKISKNSPVQRRRTHVDVPSSCAANKLASMSPPLTGSPSPTKLSTSHDEPSYRREIEVHSTMIILGDEVDDDEISDSDSCAGCSEIEFVSATGPVLPARISVKGEEEFDAGLAENEEIDVVNADNESLDVIILDNHDDEPVKCGNDDKNVVKVENLTLGLGKGNNEKVRLSENKSENTVVINVDNEDSDEFSDGSEVVNDSDCNMPSLVLMKNTTPTESIDSEEGMPPLMLIGDLSQANSSAGIGFLKTSTPSLINGDSVHTLTRADSRSNKRGSSSFLEKSLSNGRKHSSPSPQASLPDFAKSRARPQQVNPAEIIPPKHDCRNFEKAKLGFSKKTTCEIKSCLGVEGKNCTGDLMSESSDSDCDDCDISKLCNKGSCSGQSSKLNNCESVLNGMCNQDCVVSCISSAKSPLTYPANGDIQNGSLNLLNASRNQPMAVAHLAGSSEMPLKSSNISEVLGSKSPSANLPSSRPPSSYLPVSPASALLSSKVPLPRCGSPISNITTIILSSGNELREMSSRSHKKASERPLKHNDHSHESSTSSSSSRSTSRSSNHSTSSIVSSSGTSFPTSRSSPDASLPQQRASSDPSLPKSKPPSDPSLNSRSSSKSSETSSQNSQPFSASIPKKFFKDTVPNMYSSSDEECPVQENKTEIVKKIYSSARGKPEKDSGHGEISRRSALFKAHKNSATGDSRRPLALPSPPSKSSAEVTKGVLNGGDLEKQPKKVEIASKTPSSATKTSKGLPLSTAEVKPERAAKPKSLMQTSSNLKDGAERSVTSKATSKRDSVAEPLMGKDPNSVSGKANAGGTANGLKRTRGSEKPAESKNAGRSNLSQPADSDEPPRKRRDTRRSSSDAPIASKPKTRHSISSLPKDKTDTLSAKTEVERAKRTRGNPDSLLSKSSFARGKNKQKDKPAKTKKKRKKIMSDTSSDDDDDDDENRNKQRDIDDDDDDYDVRDMLEDEEDDDEDDSSHSESWELPAGVQYYDNLCSAKKCLNPEGKQVVWVMCDNCEQWYHVVCVDCPVDVVQKEDVQFHCGFC